jgi:hypothetical protein
MPARRFLFTRELHEGAIRFRCSQVEVVLSFFQHFIAKNHNNEQEKCQDNHRIKLFKVNG